MNTARPYGPCSIPINVCHYLGETAVPKGCVLQHWTRFLKFVNFIDDKRATPQNVIVMKE